MYTFFLFILFLLNILTIFFVILLYSRQNRLIHLEQRQKEMAEEIENLMTEYLLEIKEENELLLQRLESDRGTVTAQGSSQSYEAANTESADPVQTQSSAYNLKKARTAYLSVQETKLDSAEKESELPGMAEQEFDKNEKLGNEKAAENLDNKMEAGGINTGSSLTDEVLLLHQKGLSAEQIAKKLELGKTEVELLLKFHG
ncbi:DUF6115 domain-containing protein [Bacillus massiliglaciei]|uniref:DUF6115 domain-containing protein n=1 Tax=Bacillus massiliglaciei TaxID=1816693 RepID=UPI000DA63AF8|nr:hypothetical protein [Bacillus massiliglaciei]